MAKLAHYYIKYKLDDLFVGNDKNDRQKFLGALFEKKENMVFSSGEGEDKKIYKHEVAHLKLNKDIIIVRISNGKSKEVEQDFKIKNVRHEPHVTVFIDNREGCRRIAIQRNKEAFSTTESLSKIICNSINERMMGEHNIGIEITPQFYPKDFYKAWRLHQHHVAKLRFNISSGVLPIEFQNQPIDDNSITGMAIRIYEETLRKKYFSVLELSPSEKGAILPVDENSLFIRNLVNFHAATGGSIDLVTTDGAAFTCYIENDEESNKIVSSEIDNKWINALFENNGEDREKAEEQIVKFINNMKYIVDEDEHKEDVA